MPEWLDQLYTVSGLLLLGTPAGVTVLLGAALVGGVLLSRHMPRSMTPGFLRAGLPTSVGIVVVIVVVVVIGALLAAALTNVFDDSHRALFSQ